MARRTWTEQAQRDRIPSLSTGNTWTREAAPKSMNEQRAAGETQRARSDNAHAQAKAAVVAYDKGVAAKQISKVVAASEASKHDSPGMKASMHARAEEAHKEAASAMREAGNPVDARKHEAKAAEHGEKASALSSVDDRKRDDHGRFA